MKQKIQLVLFLALACFSCRKNDDRFNSVNPPLTPSILLDHPLLTLKKGNSWSYIDKIFKEDGTEVSSINRRAVITDTIMINNRTYYLINHNVDDPYSSPWLIRSEDSAVYSRDWTGTDWVWYKWSLKDGEIENSDDWNYRVQSIYSSKLFTIGNFEGYKTTITESFDFGATVFNYRDFFFKPQVGILGTIDYSLKTGGSGFYKTSESKLVSYELK